MTAPDPRPLADARPLLAALARIGASPALAWYAEEGRTELSGAVLANWVIKSIGHLDAELMLAPGTTAAIDLPEHWKATVLRLALCAVGADVLATDAALESRDGSAVPAAEVVATDRPGSPLAEGADEVLALDAASLAMRFSGDLPPLAHDWVQEVRAQPDQLQVALPAWSGPAPIRDDGAAGGAPVLVQGDGRAPDDLAAMLGAWLAGGRVVGPAAALDERIRRDEGIV